MRTDRKKYQNREPKKVVITFANDVWFILIKQNNTINTSIQARKVEISKELNLQSFFLIQDKVPVTSMKTNGWLYVDWKGEEDIKDVMFIRKREK